MLLAAGSKAVYKCSLGVLAMPVSAAACRKVAMRSALCTASRLRHNLVMKVLLAAGANPNCSTKNNEETGGFMRDCRTKAETPLHRAAAFANEEMIQMLLDAGASREARDMNGDSPLGWASWYLRPASILRKLCFGSFLVRPDYAGMETHLRGKVHI